MYKKTIVAKLHLYERIFSKYRKKDDSWHVISYVYLRDFKKKVAIIQRVRIATFCLFTYPKRKWL